MESSTKANVISWKFNKKLNKKVTAITLNLSQQLETNDIESLQTKQTGQELEPTLPLIPNDEFLCLFWKFADLSENVIFIDKILMDGRPKVNF